MYFSIFCHFRDADSRSSAAEVPSHDGCVGESFLGVGLLREVGEDTSSKPAKRCPPPRPPVPQKRNGNRSCLPLPPPAPRKLIGRSIEQKHAPTLLPACKRPRCLTYWDTLLPQASIDALLVKNRVLSSRPRDVEVCYFTLFESLVSCQQRLHSDLIEDMGVELQLRMPPPFLVEVLKQVHVLTLFVRG